VKLIIAGSRGIKDYATVRQAIIETGVWKKYGKSIEVVCGMAKGVDLLGLEFAKRNGLKWWEFPADWDNLDVPNAVIRTKRGGKKYNLNAGFDRNKRMGDFADGLLAVWDGISGGTKQMIEYAQNKGLEIYVYRVYNGDTDE
jgi:hypothetical protein